jgi:3-hydroxyisobutyryl-CoA hydrolase
VLKFCKHTGIPASDTILTYPSYAGIATHYLPPSSLPDLEARLGELQFKDSATLQERLKIIDSTIEEFTTGLPHDQPIASPVGGQIRTNIDYIFQPFHETIDQVLSRLQASIVTESEEPGAEAVRKWAAKTMETITQRSPTSVAVTFKQLRKGQTWSIAETFRREHAMASKFMEHPDFVEGVSSLLIRKPRTTPKWQPSELTKVVDADIDAFFTAKPDLELLSTEDYREYPHAWIGLPREKDVESFVNQKGNVTRDETVEHFVTITGGKLGAREKVEDILERKTLVEATGRLRWGRDRA